MFRDANSFPRAKLEKSRELRRTDNVQEQISEHILEQNGGFCAYYPSKFFRITPSFENCGMLSDIPQV